MNYSFFMHLIINYFNFSIQTYYETNTRQIRNCRFQYIYTFIFELIGFLNKYEFYCFCASARKNVSKIRNKVTQKTRKIYPTISTNLCRNFDIIIC
jgi:hypothetical protein